MKNSPEIVKSFRVHYQLGLDPDGINITQGHWLQHARTSKTCGPFEEHDLCI